MNPNVRAVNAARLHFDDANGVIMTKQAPYTKAPPEEKLRSPSTVMRLARMGSAHPTRLSFLRVLLRRVRAEGWTFDRAVWDVDSNGVGRAVYCARGPQRTYSLVAFAHDLPADMRSDRVIATAWDATFALFDGVPSSEDLDRLENNVPLQEAGRVSTKEFSLSRANRSVRLFSHVVDRLAAGRQPDIAEIDAVGYLMRTTAVYGSGKFGAADREVIACRPELALPFQAEMLSVWLIRQFSVDIVEHLARIRGGDTAVRFDQAVRERLGVGNSTGLGMAPFIVRHPVLLNNWMFAREQALARVRRLQSLTPQTLAAFHAALSAAENYTAHWHSQHPLQSVKISQLRGDLGLIRARLADLPGMDACPWDTLWLWGEDNLSLEGQEMLLSLMLEPHGDLVDDLAECMVADETSSFRLDGRMSIGDLRTLLQQRYRFALETDFQRPENTARFWYVSEEKLEPRLGERALDDGAELEQPLCIGRLANELHKAIADEEDDDPVAEFLLRHPAHRFILRRVQASARHPYMEVRDNLIGQDMLPIDLMRCKLAFFGATHFDPRSDKWVRISLFHGLPYPLDAAPGVGHVHGTE